MKISAFTLDELNLFRSQCSFTESEAACFEMKAKDETDVAIAFALNVSASTVSVIKRRMRSKIDEVLRQNVRKAAYPQYHPSCGNCQQRVLHTMAEWARLPDFISVKGQEYVYTDYRTEGKINYPRSKMGDGEHYVSELPFYTSCFVFFKGFFTFNISVFFATTTQCNTHYHYNSYYFSHRHIPLILKF